MKKFYFKKPAILAAFAVALVAVSCGLTITELKFSSHTPMQGEKLTVTSKFERASTDGQQYANYNGLYLYYGIRVPEDWTTAEMLKAVDKETNKEPVQFEFEESEFYSKLMQLSYPREGYKWLAYQSKERYDVHGQPTTSTLVLSVGNTLGTYDLDIACGSSSSDPKELLDANGEINYKLAFNSNGNNKKETDAYNLQTINEVKYIGFQEYLVNASTISKAEVDNRATALADIKVNVPVSGVDVMVPITPCDIANYRGMYISSEDKDKITPVPEFDRTIKVIENPNTGIDEVIGNVADVNVAVVDGGVEIEAEGAVATIYDVTGIVLDSKAVNGVARLSVRPGMCIVRVVNGANTTVTKVLVK